MPKVKKYNKITFIDIGTHKGQELLSLFSFRQPLKSLVITIIASFLRTIIKLEIKQFNIAVIKNKIRTCITCLQAKKSRDKFHLISVEPNYRLFNHRIYSMIDDLFPLAVGDSEGQDIELRKLFHANRDIYSQGSSIYSNKPNVNLDHFYHVACIRPDTLVKEIYKLPALKDLPIIIRINCEGSEDELIREFFNVFGDRVLLVLGSLDDVGRIKGEECQLKLMEYIRSKKIDFIKFSEDQSSWLESHKSILGFLKE